MKALTLWQPWASLVATGMKRYETRSWSTPYRGLLAIHASLKNDMTDELITTNSYYRDTLAEMNHSAFMVDSRLLPHGAILCTVRLIDVFKTEELAGKLDQREKEFGDYSSGRFAWKLELVETFRAPIVTRGYQGLWDWTTR